MNRLTTTGGNLASDFCANLTGVGTTSHPAALQGLSGAEARRRLRQERPNELPRHGRRGLGRLALDVVREPMILLLLAADAVYLVLGDRAEALLLLGSMVLIVAIELYQERRTEHALDALRDLSSPRALVIRDGEHQRVAGREVVRDDLVVLAEGERVPADVELLWCTNLRVDESLLTGESVPVRKAAHAAGHAEARPGGDDQPFAYSGSLVTSGQGVGRVVATGVSTEIGRIGRALQSLEPERTRLQRETDRVVRVLAVAGLGLCVVVVTAYAVLGGGLVEGILAGLTLAMSLLPEEFPVVLTVFLALGAWRLAQKQVLTRRSPALEALGTATVLCVDKTGTLTQNRMAVRELAIAGENVEVASADWHAVPDRFHQLLEFGGLASAVDPFDPMEQAIQDLVRRPPAEGAAWRVLVQAYPLSDELLAVAYAWRVPGQPGYTVAAKGAPEAVAELCHLDESARAQVDADVAAMANAGLRVLAVAQAHHEGAGLPDELRAFPLQLLGLIGLADPIRPTVPAAVGECHRAGVRVVMLTGDYPATAQSIARQVGLAAEPVVTGPEVAGLDEPALRQRVRDTAIFARVRPEHKLRLVRALQANGEVVAMTGDGVNDAPALKAANIGIAMGGRGTDVARESAALVLLDDEFTSIVRAVRLGRRIFDNLRKATSFLVAVHVPIAGLAVVPLLLGWPLILLPAHIVVLELIIDPTCSLVFEAEAEEPDVMRRPPRRADEPLFSRAALRLSLVRGTLVLLASLGVLVLAQATAQTDTEARALAFTTLVLGDVGLILTSRSASGPPLQALWRAGAPLWAVVGGTGAFLVLLEAASPARDLFHLAALHADDVVVVLVATLLTVVGSDVARLTLRARAAAVAS